MMHVLACVLKHYLNMLFQVVNAQGRGAVAVIVTNNVEGDPIAMMASTNNDVLIPSAMVSLESAQSIRESLDAGRSETTFIQSTNTVLSSSAYSSNQCDRVRSPQFVLNAESTMKAIVSYDIEGTTNGDWFDRANMALFNGTIRVTVSPDNGDLYSATGPGPLGRCVVSGEGGYAGSTNGAWKESKWSAEVMSKSGLVGQVVEVDIAYGPDVFGHGRGFSLEALTLQNIHTLVPDETETICRLPTDTNPALQANSTFKPTTMVSPQPSTSPMVLEVSITSNPTVSSTNTPPTANTAVQTSSAPESSPIDRDTESPTTRNAKDPTSSGHKTRVRIEIIIISLAFYLLGRLV